MGETMAHQDVLIDTIDERVRRQSVLCPVGCYMQLQDAGRDKKQMLSLTPRCSRAMILVGLLLQMDNVIKDLKTNNMKLKGLVAKVSPDMRLIAQEHAHGQRRLHHSTLRVASVLAAMLSPGDACSWHQ